MAGVPLSPKAAGGPAPPPPPGAMRWWVTGSKFGPNQAVQSATKPPNEIAGPFASQSLAQQWMANSGFDINPASWLGSWGGWIASGIESGFVNFFKDLWNVILGPIQVFAGIVIFFWVVTIYFKDDIMGLARAAGMAAMAM